VGGDLYITYNALAYDTDYRINIGAGAVYDATGNMNVADYETFTTAEAPIDTTAPTISLIHLDRSSYRLNQDDNITVSVTEDGTSTDVTINGTSGTEESNVWTRTFAHGQAEVGTYSFNVVATDGANTNTITVPYSIVAQDTPATPVVAITSPLAGATLSGDSNTVVFTTNDGDSTAAEIQIDGGEWDSATSPYSITTTEKANGSHTIRVKDTVGGVTGYSDILVFLISNNSDTTHPTVTGQSPSNGTEISDGGEISISFSEAMNLETLNSTTILLCDDAEGTTCNDDIDIIWSATDTGGTKAALGSFGSGIVLDYDATYYLIATTSVTDVAGNALATEYVGSFTVGSGPTEPEAGLVVDAMLTNTGVTNGEWNADGSAGDAYEWVFGVTLPNGESLMSLQFGDWTNGLDIDTNVMRYWSEEVEAGVLGSATNPVVITAADTYPENISITESTDNLWANGGEPGIQTNIHVQLQIPNTTPAGSHSTTFRIRSVAP